MFLTLIISVLGEGCVLVARSPSRIETTTPPPESPREATLVCAPGNTLLQGHWRWNGYRYVWVPQRCVYHPGFRYELGGYYSCGDGYCYREGRWLR